MEFLSEWPKLILTGAFTIVGGGIVAWVRGSFVSKKAHDKLVERVTKVETTVEELPSADDLHELDKRLIEVSGKLDTANALFSQVNKTTDLLMENELRGSRNGNE